MNKELIYISTRKDKVKRNMWKYDERNNCSLKTEYRKKDGGFYA